VCNYKQGTIVMTSEVPKQDAGWPERKAKTEAVKLFKQETKWKDQL